MHIHPAENKQTKNHNLFSYWSTLKTKARYCTQDSKECTISVGKFFLNENLWQIFISLPSLPLF